MSIIQSAKANGLDTVKYLEYLLENLYKIVIYDSDLKNEAKLMEKYSQMERLLPWNADIESKFKMKERSR